MTTASAQVARMLSLVPYLQKGDGVPLQRVASDFGTSTGQIVKDLKALWFCGLPGLGTAELIEIDFEAFEDNPEGLVKISNADYLQRPLRLSVTEAAALAVALKAVRDTSADDVAAIVDRVLTKLEKAGTDAGVPVILHSPDAAARRRAEIAAQRAIVEKAIGARRRLRISYYVPTRDASTARDVDPIEVVERDGVSYLDAWCHLAGEWRTFRIDRIDQAEILDIPAERAEATGRLGGDLYLPDENAADVVLRLAPSARWVVDSYPTERVEEEPNGELIAHLKVTDPRWIVRLALSLGERASVVAPDEFRERVQDEARRALALYAETKPAE